jgi:hypothetical protein
MRTRPRIAALGAALGLLACSAPPAAAQGNGHGNAYGHYKSTISAAASSSSASNLAGVSGTGVRNFGSWLDDASLAELGTGYVNFGVGIWKTPVYREIDAPTIDSGYAVHRRLQVGMSFPYFRAGAPGGPIAEGVGDIYLNAKIQVRAPSSKHFGIGVIPMMEVLSVAPPSGGSRVQWALPASLEWQRKEWRAMGTGGYFSRGAVFGAGAVEVALSSRTRATGSVSRSYSMRQDDLSTALGLAKSRTDASGGLSVAVRPDISVYGNLGRTISARDDNSATFLASAGAILRFK